MNHCGQGFYVSAFKGREYQAAAGKHMSSHGGHARRGASHPRLPPCAVPAPHDAAGASFAQLDRTASGGKPEAPLCDIPACRVVVCPPPPPPPPPPPRSAVPYSAVQCSNNVTPSPTASCAWAGEGVSAAARPGAGGGRCRARSVEWSAPSVFLARREFFLPSLRLSVPLMYP